MSSPFVMLPGPASTYDFVTTQGYGAHVEIPTRVKLGAAVLRMQVDDNSRFNDPTLVGAVTYENDTVKISLTRDEVSAIKDSFYRVTAYRNGSSYALIEGSINYDEVAIEDTMLLDSTGKIRIELLPPLVDVLADVFLRRDEYLAGEGAAPALIEEVAQITVNRHIDDATPHPTYDDLPSLRLLFENGLI